MADINGHRNTCLLLLSPLQKGCGNFTTVKRISEYFEDDGYHCCLYDPQTFTDTKQFIKVVKEGNISMILALHAARCGHLLKESPVRYVIIFGGTDLYRSSRQPELLDLMTKVVTKASALISFSHEMVNKSKEIWPDLSPSKISVIPQGVKVTPSSFSLRHCIENIYGSYTELKVFIIVGGIRPVKDPLYLIEEFSEWQKKTETRAILAFIGNIIDEQYGNMFNEAVQSHREVVIHIGYLSIEDTHAAIGDSFALVNCSKSEGMPVAILEAQLLGVPVIARNIEGNNSIVQDDRTGLMFDSPQGFVRQAERLISDEQLRDSLICNGKVHVNKCHSLAQEKQMYQQVIQTVSTNTVKLKQNTL